jgi:hypothetical protein
MRALKTTFYRASNGVQFTVSWDDEAEFLAAREFLHRLTGGLLDTHRDLDFCFLSNDEQYEAIYAYRRELERAKARRTG